MGASPTESAVLFWESRRCRRGQTRNTHIPDIISFDHNKHTRAFPAYDFARTSQIRDQVSPSKDDLFAALNFYQLCVENDLEEEVRPLTWSLSSTTPGHSLQGFTSDPVLLASDQRIFHDPSTYFNCLAWSDEARDYHDWSYNDCSCWEHDCTLSHSSRSQWLGQLHDSERSLLPEDQTCGLVSLYRSYSYHGILKSMEPRVLSRRSQASCHREPIVALDQHQASAHSSSSMLLSSSRPGIGNIASWKRTAGKSKSWKLCPKRRIYGTHPRSLRRPNIVNHDRFFVNALWIPPLFAIRWAIFKGIQYTKLVRVDAPRRESREEMRKRACCEADVSSTSKAIWKRNGTGSSEFLHIASSTNSDEGINCEPGGRFIRLTWKDHRLVRGETNCFLARGLILHDRWQIVSFLRNDSHADVYLVDDLLRSESDLQGHFFVEQHLGNCVTFAKRHKRRMRNSGFCRSSFWYGDQDMLIMRVVKPVMAFRLDKTRDFPLLSQLVTVGGNKKKFQERAFEVPSYADVVRGCISSSVAEANLNRSHMKQAKKLQGTKGKLRSTLEIVPKRAGRPGKFL